MELYKTSTIDHHIENIILLLRKVIIHFIYIYFFLRTVTLNKEYFLVVVSLKIYLSQILKIHIIIYSK